MEDYNFWYKIIQENYGIKLDAFYRWRVREVIDILGGPEEADDPDATCLLLERVLYEFKDESPAIREALRQKRESEEFMVSMVSK
jgi:hypothetical protein